MKSVYFEKVSINEWLRSCLYLSIAGKPLLNIIMKIPALCSLLVSLVNSLCAQTSTLDTTIIINKRHFSIQTKELNEQSVLLIVNDERKNITTDTLDNAIFEIELSDFNKDKYPDILFSYKGNNPTDFLYLFNPLNNKFQKVEGFLNYPSALRVKLSPNLYYSYSRAGCADLIWVSDLFKIENYKCVHLGEIYGDACKADPGEESFYIKIYKVISHQADRLSLIQTLSHSVTSHYKKIKWGFIKHYWNKNFKKFI